MSLARGQVGAINKPQEYRATLFNRSPLNVNENIPGIHPSYFSLPAPSIEERMTCLYIPKTIHYIYIDADRPMMQKETPSDGVAASIIEGLMSAWPMVGPNSRPALFYAVGEWNRDAAEHEFRNEIKMVDEMQFNWFRSILEQGDAFFARSNRDPRVITLVHREAAQRLNAKREWAFTLDPNRVCPFCAAPVVFNAVICRECHHVINIEAYKRLKEELGYDQLLPVNVAPEQIKVEVPIPITPIIPNSPKPTTTVKPSETKASGTTSK